MGWWFNIRRDERGCIAALHSRSHEALHLVALWPPASLPHFVGRHATSWFFPPYEASSGPPPLRAGPLPHPPPDASSSFTHVAPRTSRGNNDEAHAPWCRDRSCRGDERPGG